MHIDKKIKPKGTPVPECPTCSSKDIGWCSLYGGWWCDNGHSIPTTKDVGGAA